MSALTWDEAALTAPRGPRTEGMPRRHLTLVPAGEAVAGSGSGVRLTRRGRLVVTLLVTALVLTIALVGIRQATATPAPAAPIATVTVAAGETLSGIAARELPELAIREGVARIQIANNLSTTAISAGQVLRIPAP